MLPILFALLSSSVSGRITDSESGDPIPFAGVKDLSSGAGTLADESGFFYLKLAPGHHILVFSQLGYEDDTLVLNLAEGAAREIYPRIKPKAITTEEIVITGKREEFEKEIRPSAVRIEADAIRTMPAFLESDVMKTLQALPGVSAPNDFTTALYVRGSSPSENLILIDDAPVLNPFHMGGIFSTFSTDALAGLDFWMGGFPAQYGGKMSSVLAVQTKEGDTSAYHGSFDVSMLASSAFLEGPLALGASFSLSARRTYFDKVLPLFMDFEFPYYFYDVQSKIKIPLSFRSWATYTYFYSGDVLDFKLSEDYYRIRMNWGNVVNNASFTYLHSPETFSRLRVYQSYFKTYLQESSLYESDTSVQAYDWFRNSLTKKGGEYSLTWAQGDQGGLLGLEFQETDYYYHYTEGNYVFDVRKIPWRLGAYISYKGKVGNLLYRPSLRVDYYKAFSDFFRADPRLGLKWFLNKDLAWLFSCGVFHQYEVTANQQEDILPFAYFWLPVLPGQVPQRSYHFITGLERWISEAFTAKAEIYYKYIPVSYDYKYYYGMDESDQEEDFVLSPGYSAGVDLLIKKDVGALVGWVGYSFCYAMRHQDSVGWYFPSYEKRHDANLFLSWGVGRWNLGARWNLSSGTPYTGRVGRYRYVYWDDDGDLEYRWRTVWGKKNACRYPMYHKLDIFCELSFHIWRLPITLTGSVINLYNRSNVFFYYMDYSEEPPVRQTVNQLPRFFSVGIRSQF